MLKETTLTKNHRWESNLMNAPKPWPMAYFLLAALAPLLADSSAAEEASRRPNIILIMADNLGYGDLGCYGQERIQTPNLDRMATQGMRFTQFYSGAVICAPARCTVMTGLHTGHCRIRGNHRDSDIQALEPEDVTVGEVLRGAGYATALIGKWGLGDEGNAGVPNLQGFDYFFGYLNQVHAHNYYPEFLWRNQQRAKLANVVKHPEKLYQSPELGGAATKRVDYAPDLFTAEALSFIERQAPDRPFFLYLPYNYPHPNCEAWLLKQHGAEVPDYGLYADKDWPPVQKGHAAMITRMDRDIGRILERIKQREIDENTLVIFTSDNGPHKGDGLDPEFNNSNGSLRGVLREVYEGGIRVPMIARWPSHIAPGGHSYHISSLVDVLATCADVADAKTPDNDGISFLPTLLGRHDQQKQHDHIYWEFYERGSAQAVRMGDWKAVRKPMITGEIELYDLGQDPAETNDVAQSHPEVAAKIEAIMKREHTPSQHWQSPAAKKMAAGSR
jgi:arylsulfatase A-like enzyme